MVPALRRLRTAPRVIQALLDDPGAPAALLAANGLVLQAGVGLRAFERKGAELPEAVRTGVAEAVQQRAPVVLSAEWPVDDGVCPVAVRVTPTGIDRPAAVLRVVDLRPQLALEARLAQAQRLQSVGQLAAGVAHDFNNLLTAILGAADALAPLVPPAGQPDLSHIRAGAQRGAGLVRQLLAFGRQQTLQPRVLDLNDAVREAAALLRCMLCSRVTLTLDLEEPGRRVRIDPTQLNQVLMNLAVNARDAMPDGGAISVSTGRRLLLDAVTEGSETIPPGRYAVIEVRDTGNGIPADVLPHIFEPFFTTRRDAGGTGLGLSTVHGIVRQSGGFLAVASTPGAGTVFRIMLPRHDAPEAAALTEMAANRVAPAPGRRLLLVEDEAPVRRLAARALSRAGWEVIEAASPEEALEADLDGVVQLVSDVMMPGMDGPALVREVRRKLPGVPALLVSGYADAERRQALQAEDIFFLAKPFSMAALVALVGTPADTGEHA
jgi:two-component system cell cycle sensor histidine kinase/response regulator CckA